MNRIHGKTLIPWNYISQSRHRNSELSNVSMELLSSCPKAQQHWNLNRLMTTLTAKTFLNTILASPAPICQPGFFIFPLLESKLFLSFIWLHDSCPAPSKILFSRIQIFTSQSVFIYFFLILCSTEGPTSTFSQKGDIQTYTMQAISGRLFIQAASSCHKRLQRGELQREMGSASTEHRVTEPASFSRC